MKKKLSQSFFSFRYKMHCGLVQKFQFEFHYWIILNMGRINFCIITKPKILSYPQIPKANLLIY
jgi:hypothetical protein